MSALLLWIIIIYRTNGYYLSLNSFAWNNASRYCQTYCNTHLASIHNEQNYQSVIDQLQMNDYTIDEVWLGLNDMIQGDLYQWTDETPFDFGNQMNSDGYIMRGSHPWANDEPTPNAISNDKCVAIDIDTNLWSKREEWNEFNFICNSCNGKIAKYAALTGHYGHEEANTICQQRFGTSLASIHGETDMTEARITCRETNSINGCWIGLHSHDTKAYIWEDGTEFDYGSKYRSYPWFTSEPHPRSKLGCIRLAPNAVNEKDEGEYLFDDISCDYTASILCNAPSEICDENQWFSKDLVSKPYWTWDKLENIGCTLSNDDPYDEYNLIIGDKQFYNGDAEQETLIVDMMYTVTDYKGDASAGIVFYFDKNDCKNYYYVGIWPEPSVIFFAKFINGVWTLITWSRIGFKYKLGSYYALKVQIEDKLIWDLYVNDILKVRIQQQLHMEMEDTELGLSGHIGIRKVNTSVIIKSLYVSGEVRYMEEDTLWRKCQKALTDEPTQEPTLEPTGNPSLEPTLEPTPEPSKLHVINDIIFPTSPPVYTRYHPQRVASTHHMNLFLIISVPVCGIILLLGATCLAKRWLCPGDEYEFVQREGDAVVI